MNSKNFFQHPPRDPERITLMLAKIEEIWKKSPQLRLGQLIGNCVHEEIKLYYMADDVLLEKLETMYELRLNSGSSSYSRRCGWRRAISFYGYFVSLVQKLVGLK